MTFCSLFSPYFSSGGYNPEHLAMDTNAAGLSLHLSLLFIVGLGEVVPVLHSFPTHPQVLPDSEGETPVRSGPEDRSSCIPYLPFDVLGQPLPPDPSHHQFHDPWSPRLSCTCPLHRARLPHSLVHLQAGRHGGGGPRSWYKNIESLLILKTFTQVLTKRRSKMTTSPSSYKLHLVLPSFPLW